MITNMKLVPQRGCHVTNYWALLYVDRLARFEIEDDFMFRAVIFEHAANIFRSREQEQKTNEDREADQAIHKVEEDLAFDDRRPVAKASPSASAAPACRER